MLTNLFLVVFYIAMFWGYASRFIMNLTVGVKYDLDSVLIVIFWLLAYCVYDSSSGNCPISEGVGAAIGQSRTYSARRWRTIHSDNVVFLLYGVGLLSSGVYAGSVTVCHVSWLAVGWGSLV